MCGFLDVCPDGKPSNGAGVGTSNVTVNLLDGGNQIASTTTDNSGDYVFQHKPAKDGYTVEVVPGSGCGSDALSPRVNLSTTNVDGVDFALARDCGTGSIFGSLGSLEFCLS